MQQVAPVCHVIQLSHQDLNAVGQSESQYLFVQISLPLGQRNRSINDFYIEPDDPWRSYFPGDTIKGTVFLMVVRPVRITHLVICLHGYVKVFKNAVPAGEAPPDLGFLGPGRGRRGAEYMGNGLATLFEDEVVLCGDGRLKEGIYKFRFEMGLPPYSLPSSINVRNERESMSSRTLISPHSAPKARIVTLEPISKRSKTKAKSKSASSETTAPTDNLSINTHVSLPDTPAERPPLSPSPSNVSSSSRPSNSSQSFQIASDPSSSASTGRRNSESYSAPPSISEKNITAKTEVMRAGVLPGDTLPIIVTINHCKAVRSAQGIIITLYRQGRIDLHPAIPIGSQADGKKPVYEDCYPRSRTGLGGLTLGTTRTSSTFRKDLSQSFAPLIVNPSDMTAIVKTSIRIPEDAFPTITRVPGAMINFRYYVEVILNPADANGTAITANWAGNILDTDQVRRSKGVISVAFEVVVGTRDSQRNASAAERMSFSAADSNASNPPPESSTFINPGDTEDWPEASPHEYGHEEEFSPEQEWPEHPEEYPSPYQPNGQMAPFPELDEPEDEKARVRRHEETLLPSQPPGEDEAGPSTREMAMPTAPVLSDDHHLQDYEHVPSSSRDPLPYAVRSAESLQTIVVNGNSAEPSAPSAPHEDKQELERQRLMDLASAPREPPTEDTGEGPSAPVFDEDDQLVGGTAHADESLPRYQR
ncbi:hypothetical protein N7470_004645 [Penicillium chermesinum]|nr:hypothetical protein N7470_004645 [Penicillium chermesinum]